LGSKASQILLHHRRKLTALLHEAGYPGVVSVPLKLKYESGKLVHCGFHMGKIYPIAAGCRVSGKGTSLLEE
jgi:hypothetical protein